MNAKMQPSRPVRTKKEVCPVNTRALFAAGIRLAAIAALLAPVTAQAGYVNNRSGWLRLSAEARAGYVQGMNDSLNFIYSDDSLPSALLKKARTDCLSAQRTTSAILADRITTAYKDDRFENVAPTALYIIKMQEVCRSYINDQRTSFGLPPL
jgi:hypothetical protein